VSSASPRASPRASSDSSQDPARAIALHERAARRRARFGMLAFALGLALLLWARYHVLRVDAELDAAGVERTTSVLYRAAALYFVAFAVGLLGALGGVLVSALSWMYLRHLSQERAGFERGPH
jgi:hypothetical protein